MNTPQLDSLMSQTDRIGEQLEKLRAAYEIESPRSLLTTRRLHRLDFAQYTLGSVKRRLRILINEYTSECEELRIMSEDAACSHDALIKELTTNAAACHRRMTTAVLADLEDIEAALHLVERHLQAL